MKSDRRRIDVVKADPFLVALDKDIALITTRLCEQEAQGRYDRETWAKRRALLERRRDRIAALKGGKV